MASDLTPFCILDAHCPLKAKRARSEVLLALQTCRLPAIITFEDHNFALFHLIDTRPASLSNYFLSTQLLLHVYWNTKFKINVYSGLFH
ncbi:hypothetical protein D3C75_338150 [compost metagenome]